MLKIIQYKVIQEHSQTVFDAKYAPSGSMLATASKDKSVLLWNLQNWTVTHVLKHAHWVLALAWHPTREELLSTASEELCAWNAQTGEMQFSILTNGILSVEWLTDGERFACGDSSGNLFFYVTCVYMRRICTRRVKERSYASTASTTATPTRTA
jgi:WD40 repeat protein